MPRFIALALLSVLPVVLAVGCTTEAESDKGPVQFEVLRKFMAEPHEVKCSFKQGLARDSVGSEGLSNLEKVIKSQAEFDAYISCDDTVSIDFDKEYVLAGISTYQPNQIRIEELALERAKGSLTFRVGLQNSAATSPSRAEYIIKVKSRDYVEYPVVFDVYWKEG
jgi:hypothetical protein